MDRLLTMPEVSAMLRIPVDTLRFYRVKRIGPDSFRLGKRIMYREADVSVWLEQQMAADRSRTAV